MKTTKYRMMAVTAAALLAASVLEAGDVIVQINRKPVTNVAEALTATGGTGDAVYLKILRSGRTKFVILKS